MKSLQTQPASLRQINRLAKLMDAQFTFPGTNIKFGFDALLGLVPGAGDISTFAVSGYMVMVMSKNGASGFVLARMILNILIDAIFGAVPLIGDLFDVAFKANMRNMKLMDQYYTEGRHRGGAWKLIIPILLLVFLIIVAIIYGVYKLIIGLF
jgi:hypothetical protein